MFCLVESQNSPKALVPDDYQKTNLLASRDVATVVDPSSGSSEHFTDNSSEYMLIILSLPWMIYTWITCLGWVPVFATNVMKKISNKIQRNLDYTIMNNSSFYFIVLQNKMGITVTEECSIKCDCRWELWMFSSKIFMCLQSNI